MNNNNSPDGDFDARTTNEYASNQVNFIFYNFYSYYYERSRKNTLFLNKLCDMNLSQITFMSYFYLKLYNLL